MSACPIAGCPLDDHSDTLPGPSGCLGSAPKPIRPLFPNDGNDGDPSVRGLRFGIHGDRLVAVIGGYCPCAPMTPVNAKSATTASPIFKPLWSKQVIARNWDMLVLLRESVRPTFCFGAPLNRLAGGREKSREGKFICSAASEEKKIPTGRYPDQTIPIYGAESHAKVFEIFCFAPLPVQGKPKLS